MNLDEDLLASKKLTQNEWKWIIALNKKRETIKLQEDNRKKSRWSHYSKDF